MSDMNENVQKAKDAAANAGKKLGEGVSGAAENVRNSAAYAKVMENQNVQKAAKFLGRFDKKVQIIIVVAAIVLVIGIIGVVLSALFGNDDGDAIVIENDGGICKHEVTDGKAGFAGFSDSQSGKLYFKGIDGTTNYLIEGEDGHKTEEYGGFEDTMEIKSKDSNGDGYVEFKIKKLNDDADYELLCVVKGEIAKKE
ncbi:MAG: hypothetical protein IJ696_01510 [Ruminococcus sp.]|nr:hypothetical protein [Ruminococcus sp.]